MLGAHNALSLLTQTLTRLQVRRLGGIPTDLFPIRIVRIQTQRTNDIRRTNKKVGLVGQ